MIFAPIFDPSFFVARSPPNLATLSSAQPFTDFAAATPA